MYYFPSPFIVNEVIDSKNYDLASTVNSGKNALRIALKSLSLPINSTVGIPVFSCNEVVNAVMEEGLKPVFFDVKEIGSYWADHNEQKILNLDVKAIIVTHLYGFLHPDTLSIIDMCSRNNIKLIHDLAQSFGMDISLFKNNLIIYSFGPGKSTSAAKGGEVLNLPGKSIVAIRSAGFWDDMSAKLFFNSRLFGSKRSNVDVFIGKLCHQFIKKTGFIAMTPFQKQKALEAKAIALTLNNGRRERYLILKNAILNLNTVRVVYESQEGLWFKIVLFVKERTDHFLTYLKKNYVPYCRLGDSMDMTKRDMSDMVFFKETYSSIIEISSERSIPMVEIQRVSTVLSNYENEN